MTSGRPRSLSAPTFPSAADRLGQDDIGPAALLERIDLFHQLVEPAAETGAGHFLDIQALAAQALRVDTAQSLSAVELRRRGADMRCPTPRNGHGMCAPEHLRGTPPQST